MVKRSSQLRWHFFAGLVIPVFTLIAKLRIVRGVLPPTGPFIIAPNHYSEI